MTERSISKNGHELLLPKGSEARNISQESFIYLSGNAAIAEQLIMVPIAIAVNGDGEGIFFGNQWQRAYDTLVSMARLKLGTVEESREAAKFIGMRHKKVAVELPEPIGVFPSGVVYRPRTTSLSLWVLATLNKNAVNAHNLLVRQLEEKEMDAFVLQNKVFAPYFLEDPDTYPQTYRQVLDLYDETIEQGIVICPEAKALMDAVFTPLTRNRPQEGLIFLDRFPRVQSFLNNLRSSSLQSVEEFFRDVGMGLIEPRIRESYGYEWDEEKQRRFDSFCENMRSVSRLIPSPIRHALPVLFSRLPLPSVGDGVTDTI